MYESYNFHQYYLPLLTLTFSINLNEFHCFLFIHSESSFISTSIWIHNCSDLLNCVIKFTSIKHLLFKKTWSNIIIIIMSCRQHRYPLPSLATSPYHSSPLVGPQGYIPYSHIAAVCMFYQVVLLLHGHMWESIGVHHLWARVCFSSCVLRVWFVKLW